VSSETTDSLAARQALSCKELRLSIEKKKMAKCCRHILTPEINLFWRFKPMVKGKEVTPAV
jgi:hypothetical protein